MNAMIEPAGRRKIAIIVPGGVDRSGEYRVIPALLALLKRLSQRHDVHVFCFAQEPQPGEWELCGARIHNAGSGRRLQLSLAVLREHRRGAFHIVHTIWSGACSLAGVSLARLLGLPSIVHVAGGELAAIADIGYGGALRWRGRFRERITLRAASAVTAASRQMITSVADLGIAAARVPLGVDAYEWPPLRPRRRAPGDTIRLLHVASLNVVKDQTTLLRAMSLLKNRGCAFALDIVGEDTLQGAMQDLARELHLDDVVTFHGFRTQRQWRLLAEAAHILVMSSRHEAGPLVVLEAALAGVPTVGTAVGHIAEWAPTAAVAVPVADAERLAAGVQRLMDDEALRLQIAEAAFANAAREDADFTSAAFLRLYEQLS